MANQKLTQLDALVTPANDDLMYIVDDPSGTPLSKKITWANLLAALGLSAYMPLAGGSFSGGVNYQDNILQRPKILDYGESVNAIGATGGGTQDIDLTLGNVVSATVDTSANTFTFSNPSASGVACSFTFLVRNGGSQTVNWPNSVDWGDAGAPVLTASGLDVLTFLTVDGGTTWLGFKAGTGFA